MKKISLLICILLFSAKGYAFYDFCESPQEYNTFPQAYDVKTEYWKDIPEYNPKSIEMNDTKTKPQKEHIIIKQNTDNSQIEIDKK